ncbi:MAG TPA: helix-turn-helix domain-containing protein [Roseiarcus sp.]|jgi:hypothetical protein
MSVTQTKGVGGLARMLRRLSDGPASSVADIASAEGLSRSTAYRLAKRLQIAQIVARDPSGKLIAGPGAVALGYGRFGVTRLHGPAEAILRWLRDHCDATTSLTCADGTQRVTLLCFSASWARPGAAARGATITHEIRNPSGREAARLEIACGANLGKARRAEIDALAQRAKATLEHHLREGPEFPPGIAT